MQKRWGMETSGCCDKPIRLRYYEWEAAAAPDDDGDHHRPIDIKLEFRSDKSGFGTFISPS